ncbi:hypothetical protein H1164_16460 [Thermoactinomyces daqus]|uniref:Uncharacterized protein n=2 Tax=Thermoactinomyces TaxID=2023 RepID=A0A7W1XD10_9BACL|nr:hypothetical protein [Thermoactinomyces daqus]MBA4544431.1 hypothetical protein [Thermoactinomyces daqus]
MNGKPTIKAVRNQIKLPESGSVKFAKSREIGGRFATIRWSRRLASPEHGKIHHGWIVVPPSSDPVAKQEWIAVWPAV